MYVHLNVEGAGGTLIHADIEVGDTSWTFVDNFWGRLQMTSALHVPFGLNKAMSGDELSVTTSDGAGGWQTRVLTNFTPGEVIFWHDASSHAGGSSAAVLLSNADGSPQTLLAVYATSAPASAAQQAAWWALYNASNLQFANNCALADPPGCFPGTAHWALEYDFANDSLLPAGVPTFVGISLSNTQGTYDVHNEPVGCKQTRKDISIVILGSHGKPLVYRRSLQPNTLQAGLTDPEFVYGQCITEKWCGIETYPAWLVTDDQTIHLVARTTAPLVTVPRPW